MVKITYLSALYYTAIAVKMVKTITLTYKYWCQNVNPYKCSFIMAEDVILRLF